MDIRTVTSAEELRQVFELEHQIWGYQTVEDSVTVLMLLVSTRIGGLVVGAFEAGRMVGFAYALPGIRDGKPYQWSHMLGVLPEYRNGGLGHELKLEQRRRVIASGLDLIAWTYDPLQALNAHLNFVKLGTVARSYHLDAYPGSTSDLHAGTSTDRLIAEWWLRTERVEQRLAAVERHEPPPREAGAVHAINRVRGGGEWLTPDGHDSSLDEPRLGITIPTGFTEMQQRDLALAKEWRAATREMFTTYLGRGYEVVDFVLDRPGSRGTYVLSASLAKAERRRATRT
jgi:predicted GNAT superfamily acetyltransferase